MRKSFRDKVQDALARKHAIVISRSGKTTRTAKVDVITAEVAFKHFWGKSFRKCVTTSVAAGLWSGTVYIAGWKFSAEGESYHTVLLRLAHQFCDTVPLFTASGKEIERQVDNG